MPTRHTVRHLGWGQGTGITALGAILSTGKGPSVHVVLWSAGAARPPPPCWLRAGKPRACVCCHLESGSAASRRHECQGPAPPLRGPSVALGSAQPAAEIQSA